MLIGDAEATVVGDDVVVGVITMAIEIIAMAAVLVLFCYCCLSPQRSKARVHHQR